MIKVYQNATIKTYFINFVILFLTAFYSNKSYAQTLNVNNAVTGLSTTFTGGLTNQAVFGFVLTPSVAVTLGTVVITHNSVSLNDNFVAANYRLGTCTTAAFTNGTFTAITTGVTITVNPTNITITGLNTLLASGVSRFFFLRADVRATFLAGYPTKTTFSLNNSAANTFQTPLPANITTNAYSNISNILIPNLARTEGTAFYWNNIPAATSTSNTSKTTSVAGINDGTTNDLGAPTDVTAQFNWHAAGITWPTAKNNIGSIKYYNGRYSGRAILNNIYDNGYFHQNIKIQSTTDGTTWLDQPSWACFPAYPYDFTASSQVYTFTGPTINNIRGLRVLGQLRTDIVSDSYSYALSVTEIEIFPVNVYYFKPPQSAVTTLANWGVNTDGTGTSPSSFAEPTEYYFTSNETFNSPITSSASTQFFIGNGGPGAILTLGASATISNATVNIPLASSGSNTLQIAGATAPIIGTLSTGALGSTVEYNGGTQTVGNYAYNNLTITNNGVKTLGGNTTVGRNLTIQTGTAKLALGSNTLTLNGDFIGTATNSLQANGSSNLVIGGTGAMTSNLFFDNTTTPGKSRGADPLG
ncbi:MAG: hypothetical protein EAZ51_08645, partial [Sphingobacteriales bacterium]